MKVRGLCCRRSPTGAPGLAWNQAPQQPAVKPERGPPRKDAPAPPPTNTGGSSTAAGRWSKTQTNLKPTQLDVRHELRRTGSMLDPVPAAQESERDLCRIPDFVTLALGAVGILPDAPR